MGRAVVVEASVILGGLRAVTKVKAVDVAGVTCVAADRWFASGGRPLGVLKSVLIGRGA